MSSQLRLFLQDVSESPKIGIPKVSSDDFYLTKFSAAVISCKSINLVPALIANLCHVANAIIASMHGNGIISYILQGFPEI